jgi:hypothetical protein
VPVPEVQAHAGRGRAQAEAALRANPAVTEIPVSLVTDEMVTRAHAAFMQNVTAVTPKPGGSGYIHPRAAIRKALEAALDGQDLDGAAAILHREPDGTLSARIGSQRLPRIIPLSPDDLTPERAAGLTERIRAALGKPKDPAA